MPAIQFVQIATGDAAPLQPADGAGVTVPFTISWSSVLPANQNGGYNWQVSPSPSFAQRKLLSFPL